MADNSKDDLTNISLSKRATDIANQMKDSGEFVDALSAAKFAMAYVIKYYKDEIDTPEKVEKLDSVYDSAGNHYNVGSVDPDHYISKLFDVLYPVCSTPYRYARVIMCLGLSKLGDLADENHLFPIGKTM